MSFLGSFMTLSHRYLTRKATFAGAPDSSLLEIESEYFFWFAKSSSSPPLQIVKFYDSVVYPGPSYLNSTLICNVSSPISIYYWSYWKSVTAMGLAATAVKGTSILV